MFMEIDVKGRLKIKSFYVSFEDYVCTELS